MSAVTSSKTPLHVNAATGGASVTPSDTDAVDFNGLYIGGAGDIKVDLLNGSTVTLSSALAGTIYPLRVTKVYSTGTTATNIVGLTW